MRTTLNIDDALIRAVRRRAAELGSTMTAVIETALRQALVEPSEAPHHGFDWVVVPGGPQAHVDITDRDALFDLLDPPV